MHHSEPRYEVSVEEAIRRGHREVNYPVMGIFLLPLPLIWLFRDVPDVIWISVLVLTFVGAWTWWSWRLPQWRVWALENVDDLDRLISTAVAEKLMWPPGHFFEKTEIKSSALRQRERSIMDRRVEEVRRKQESRESEVTRGLRDQVLTMSPSEVGIEPGRPNDVWCVLMEMAFPDAVVTLVTVADGTTSLYFSHGGGIIGAGQHEAVRSASDRLIRSASAYLHTCDPSAERALPSPGHTRFHIRTFGGSYTAEAPEEVLAAGGHPLAPLFALGQDVITAVREATPARG